jgi:hypothetical protein
MADTKISALPASTTPLAGTEVLPIVQSSTTKQVSVANLTAGRSFDALGMTLTSTDAGAAAAPLLELYRDSATPAASDTLGEIEFNGEDSAGNKQAYGLIHASILSPTSTAEQGQLHFETATAGALTEKMIIGTTNLVINEIGAVYNVRIEGDTDANLFYTDATNSRVGVGLTNPTEKFEVVGNIKLSGNVMPASGFGIDFAATSGTGTSELLADYEEGTWTPALTSASGAFTTVTLGADTSAYYTKIGREVTFQMWFTTDAITAGTASGDVYISLPFTAATLAGAGDHSSASVSLSLNFTINHPDSALVRGGDAKMNLIYRTVANGGTSNLQVGSLATGAGSNIVVISGLYIAA